MLILRQKEEEFWDWIGIASSNLSFLVTYASCRFIFSIFTLFHSLIDCIWLSYIDGSRLLSELDLTHQFLNICTVSGVDFTNEDTIFGIPPSLFSTIEVSSFDDSISLHCKTREQVKSNWRTQMSNISNGRHFDILHCLSINRSHTDTITEMRMT